MSYDLGAKLLTCKSHLRDWCHCLLRRSRIQVNLNQFAILDILSIVPLYVLFQDFKVAKTRTKKFAILCERIYYSGLMLRVVQVYLPSVFIFPQTSFQNSTSETGRSLQSSIDAIKQPVDRLVCLVLQPGMYPISGLRLRRAIVVIGSDAAEYIGIYGCRRRASESKTKALTKRSYLVSSISSVFNQSNLAKNDYCLSSLYIKCCDLQFLFS